MTATEKRVIVASSLGTVFEWYDFYLVGALAAEISRHIFSGVNPAAAFIFTLLGFAAGFAVRPFGAIVFGRLGDMVGRKYTFLLTIVLMGAATFAIGLLPGYASIGIAAPVIFIAMRMLQGLALGGEYGGAVTYVAEHAPDDRRGAWTSWVQITASLGLLLALGMILGLRHALGEAAFSEWGWRLPFLFSIVLLGISVWMRLKLDESPAFRRMKAAGRTSKAPLSEAFGRWGNLKLVLVAFIGLAMGQAVIWYTGQFYSLFFLTQTLKVDGATAALLVALATVLSVPFYFLTARLSDRIGRKPVFMAGLLSGILFFFPLYQALTHYVNPALEVAQRNAPITVTADPAECSLQFNPVGTAKFLSSCDVARASLSKAGLNYSTAAAAPGAVARIGIGSRTIDAYDARTADPSQAEAFNSELRDALREAGYSAKADPAAIDKPMAVLVLLALMVCGTITYGPLAALLVEMFPTRIRYTSLSLPYHVGIGWFGGFLPAAAFAIVAATGNIYSGLWYPVVIAAIALIVCLLFLKETRGADIHAGE
jgi:MFS-type transporter involved in bile tolerance (Atg22 family)